MGEIVISLVAAVARKFMQGRHAGRYESASLRLARSLRTLLGIKHLLVLVKVSG
jgi:hypothetical protein